MTRQRVRRKKPMTMTSPSGCKGHAEAMQGKEIYYDLQTFMG